jgi:hypothetical protein
VLAGHYADAKFVVHGFLRARDGTFATFDAPGAGTISSQGTFPQSINPTRSITGFYIDANFVAHGFLRSREARPEISKNVGVVRGE